MKLLDPSFLLASLLSGSVGIGYCIYGKRQKSWAPLVAGVLMVAASYLVGTALLMSLVCLGLMTGVYLLLKRGY